MAFTSRVLTRADLPTLTVGQRVRLASNFRLSFAALPEAEAAMAAHFSPVEPCQPVTGVNQVPSTAAGIITNVRAADDVIDVLVIWRDGATLKAGVAPRCSPGLFRTAHPAGRLPGEPKPGTTPSTAEAKTAIRETTAALTAKIGATRTGPAVAPALVPATVPYPTAPAAASSPLVDSIAAAVGAALSAAGLDKPAPAASGPSREDLQSVMDLAARTASDQRALRRHLDAALAGMESAKAAADGIDAKVDAKLAPIMAALGSATPAVRARVAIATGSAANPLVAKLNRFGYTPGQECPANVLLAAPPSIGKTFAVRELGKLYDLYLEHGCSDDLDEVPTLLGGATPDGAGGFIVADGVMTEAMRAAASGRTVLVLLDEVLRLSERAQEWLLSFLTGFKTETGRVYRLRTRRAIDGKLEVLECPTTHLHLVAATNLGPRTPVEAFWSRWEVIRLAFDATLIKATGTTIAQSYGLSATHASTLADRFAAAMVASRKAVTEGALKFSLDLRDLERGVQLATTGTAAPTADEVCRWIADRAADKCAHWSVDLGETDHTISGAAIGAIRTALRVGSR